MGPPQRTKINLLTSVDEMVGMDHQVDGQQPPEKGDKRFGKRSDAAKKAVSEVRCPSRV